MTISKMYGTAVKVYNMYPTGHDAGIEHDVRGSYTYSLEMV